MKENYIKFIQYVTDKLIEIENRLKKVEDNELWITRLIIGTIISAMIGTILILKK